MCFFPLLTLSVSWSNKVPALRDFLPQFPSPAHELSKFADLLHLPPASL